MKELQNKKMMISLKKEEFLIEILCVFFTFVFLFVDIGFRVSSSEVTRRTTGLTLLGRTTVELREVSSHEAHTDTEQSDSRGC